MSKSRTQSSETRRQGKVKRTAQVLPSPNGILQLLSIAKGIYEACGLPLPGPVEHLPIPTLPPWGQKICQQLSVTIFRGFVDVSPHESPVKWRNFGRMLGVGLRELGFIKHDMCRQPNLSLQSNTNEKLREVLESLVGTLGGEHADALISHFGNSLENLLRIGLGQAPSEQYEFFAGLAEGQVLVWDTQGQFVGDRGRTTIYFELLSRWMEIEEMRQAKPAKTCADLYELVAPSLGDPRRERIEWFFGVCKRIGLRMGTPGRPRKSEENN